jgi:purine nucleosidase
VFTSFQRIELVDWEATLAHGLLHQKVVEWLQADSERARFYERVSRKTREWSEDRRGDYWHSADGLAMAYALDRRGAEQVDRPVAVETGRAPGRGATVVDWQRHTGRPDHVRITLRYDQARFEALVQAALAAA